MEVGAEGETQRGGDDAELEAWRTQVFDGPGGNKPALIANKATLYHTFRCWCQAQGERTVNNNTFFQQIKSYKKEEQRPTISGVRYKVWALTKDEGSQIGQKGNQIGQTGNQTGNKRGTKRPFDGA